MLDVLWIITIFVASILAGLHFGWLQADPYRQGDLAMTSGVCAVGGMMTAFWLVWPGVGGPMESWLEQALPQNGQDINVDTAWAITLIVHFLILTGLLGGAMAFGDWLWDRFHLARGPAAGESGAPVKSPAPKPAPRRFPAVNELMGSLPRGKRLQKGRPRAPDL